MKDKKKGTVLGCIPGVASGAEKSGQYGKLDLHDQVREKYLVCNDISGSNRGLQD